VVATTPDDQLDMAELRGLLKRVKDTVHTQPNRVRYCMVGFVICVGCYVKALKDEAIGTAEKMGKVSVDMGDTECKVPDPVEYIRKVEKRGSLGKKRKSMKC
jgi:hypothetical protein